MSIKQKIKSAISKLKKNADKLCDNAELAAEEVISAEVFPEKKCARKRSTAKVKKPAAKRSRPTNGNYRMIDPTNDTVDGSKS